MDASALLAFLFDEPGAEVVTATLEEGNAIISSVNIAETVSKLVDKHMPEHAIYATLDSIDMEVVVFDERQAKITGMLREVSRSLGLSLGDRACLALSMTRACTVLTADVAWREIPFDQEVRLIR